MNEAPRRDAAPEGADSPASIDPRARPGTRGDSVWRGMLTHPIGTVAGALAGLLLGALIGMAAGPVGSLLGAALGGVTGALLGGGMPVRVGRPGDDDLP